MHTKIRILITGALHPNAIGQFESHPDFVVDYRPDCPRSQILELVRSCHVLVTRSETDVDAELLQSAPELKVIARAAVGVGNIDLVAATQGGILVINCPGKNTNSAAELSMGLILAMLRNLPQAHAHLKAGGWDRHRFTGHELRDKKLGLIGLGNVGHRVARFAQAFDMKVSAYDPYISPDMFRRYGVEQKDSLADLVSDLDILSMHVPLNEETHGMLSETTLRLMPKGSYLVNAARGGLYDESVLLKLLEEEHLAGAAIDTFATEPQPLRALLDHPRVWVSPHIGASTIEAQQAIGETIYQQVVKAMERGVVDYPVNLPDVAIMDDPLLKEYAVLAEKLGALVGQLVSFNPKSAEIQYRGDIAALDHSLVRLAWMKGYASKVVDSFVSFVNVSQVFEQLGIEIHEREDPGFADYRSALKVNIRGEHGQMLSVGGVVFDQNYPRITLINDFYFEIEPSGLMLVVENHDRPGVIGDVGHFLAVKLVNIDRFELSRNRRGGAAMSLIRLDSAIARDDLVEMQKIKNLISVRSVTL